MANSNIVPSKAPNLIVARPQYDMQQQELFKNQLRLYFVQVDNTSQQLSQAYYSQLTTQWLGNF
jgi:hypothetical protein